MSKVRALALSAGINLVAIILGIIFLSHYFNDIFRQCAACATTMFVSYVMLCYVMVCYVRIRNNLQNSQHNLIMCQVASGSTVQVYRRVYLCTITSGPGKLCGLSIENSHYSYPPVESGCHGHVNCIDIG